ncbi:NAD(P)H-dependent glycerol-3-phosphate dehydrogenase [Desulfurobacterium crinifex]
MPKIVIVGAGTFGTALGNSLSYNSENEVVLLAREQAVADAINSLKINTKYFPYVQLNNRISAKVGVNVLEDAHVVFLAIPSSSIIEFIQDNKIYVNSKSLIVNLAKGFGKDGETLIESLRKLLPDNRVITMKGPTFADELIRGFPSAFTVGSESVKDFEIVRRIARDTNICLDFSNDIIGVELLSVLKNIYAIALGIVDAHFNSANTRFLILTKAFNEIKGILKIFGGSEETLYRYCGIGDFGLTGLNDLSRNRTLGLMIGKGFLRNSQNQSSVVLEGVRAIKVVYRRLLSQNGTFSIIALLYKLLEGKVSVQDFINRILTQE